MYRDAANRKIKEPIDYLIEAGKKSKKICIALYMSEHLDLLAEAERLKDKIEARLSEQPVEAWETEAVV